MTDNLVKEIRVAYESDDISLKNAILREADIHIQCIEEDLERSFRHWESDVRWMKNRIEQLEVALRNLIGACDAGKMVSKPGACGMTIEAQTRHSWINKVEAWSVEVARDALGEKKDER